MAATIQKEVERLWACRLFAWTEVGEARGITAAWSAEPLVIGRYVELKGIIHRERLPLQVMIDMESRIERERRFLAWVGQVAIAAKEDWMDDYPQQRLSDYLEVEFAVKEADIFKDELMYSFGNVGSNTEDRGINLLFLSADDSERRRVFESLSLQQRYDQGIIAFRIMADANTRKVTGLELSTVWHVSGGGESIGKPEYFFDIGLQYKYEGEDVTLGESLEGKVKPEELIAYRLLGRSPESCAGPIELEFYLAFIYWNTVQQRYMPLPDGIEVRAVDYDHTSRNDIIGHGTIVGGNRRTHIVVVSKDEDNPDVFFEVLTDGRYIELETSVQNHPSSINIGAWLSNAVDDSRTELLELDTCLLFRR